MEHEQKCEQAAKNILAMLAGSEWTPTVVLAALKLAYSTGAHDQSLKSVMSMIEKDDHLSQVTG